jgi:hypothetical protein
VLEPFPHTVAAGDGILNFFDPSLYIVEVCRVSKKNRGAVLESELF